MVVYPRTIRKTPLENTNGIHSFLKLLKANAQWQPSVGIEWTRSYGRKLTDIYDYLLKKEAKSP